jgi:hypothetical protein
MELTSVFTSLSIGRPASWITRNCYSVCDGTVKMYVWGADSDLAGVGLLNTLYHMEGLFALRYKQTLRTIVSKQVRSDYEYHIPLDRSQMLTEPIDSEVAHCEL